MLPGALVPGKGSSVVTEPNISCSCWAREGVSVRIRLASPTDLSLKLKCDVIKTAEKEPRIGICKLGKLISCGKTQISSRQQ